MFDINSIVPMDPHSVALESDPAFVGFQHRVGYWGSWSMYKGIRPIHLDVCPYTAVVFSFAGINSKYHLISMRGTYEEYAQMEEFNRIVKWRKPGIRTLLAVGGYNFNNEDAPTRT
jgi:GH18 family chitinase